MKMKSLILAFSLFTATVTAYAQKAVLTTAKTEYHKFDELKRANTTQLGLASLNTAKEAIDKATVHAKTKEDASAWAYKAMIYADLAMLDSVESKTVPLISEVTSSMKKSSELDKEGKSKNDILRANQMLHQISLNDGVRAYRNKQFPEAYKAFNSGLTYAPGDTTLTYYAGISAVNFKDYDKAIEKYTELIKTNFSQVPQVYLDLSSIYLAKKDTTSAIRVASEGSKKFPSNTKLAKQEIELSLTTGKEKEIISKIEEQAAKEPDNKTLPFYLGIAYAASNDIKKAEEAYKKALAIDPNYADANLNVGVIILNNGIEINNKASKIPPAKQKEYVAMMKDADTKWDEAFPYLQKAVEADPKSGLALDTLRKYYVLKKNEAKATELTKQLDALR